MTGKPPPESAWDKVAYWYLATQHVFTATEERDAEGSAPAANDTAVR